MLCPLYGHVAWEYSFVIESVKALPNTINSKLLNLIPKHIMGSIVDQKNYIKIPCFKQQKLYWLNFTIPKRDKPHEINTEKQNRIKTNSNFFMLFFSSIVKL